MDATNSENLGITMKLIGFDSALAHTGWCILEDDRLIEYGVISTYPHNSMFKRIAYLRDQLGKVLLDGGALLGNGNRARVVIEKTDWSRGKRDTREAWIRETGAREALAIGVTTAFCVCQQTGVVPIVLGPNEWHREIGAHRKEGVAAYVAAVFSDNFRIVCKETERRGKRSFAQIVIDCETEKPVPDHVTDAIAMTLVASRRLQLDSRIQRKGE